MSKIGSLTSHEIHSQYESLKKTYDLFQAKKAEIADFYAKNTPERVVLIGSGSSFSICQSAAVSIRLKLGVEANAVAAGDLMLHTDSYAPMLKNAWIIALSRSGATHEVLNTINIVRSSYGCKVVGIVCVEDSPISVSSDLSIEVPWSFDESVCQTRSVSNLYASVQLLTAVCSGVAGIEEEIAGIAENGAAYLEKIEPVVAQIACSREWKNAFVLADGEMAGIADEAALALTEISYLYSKQSRVLDVRHGPILLANQSTIMLVCVNQDGKEHQLKLVKDLVARGAGVILFSAEPFDEVEGVLAQVDFGRKLSASTLSIPMLAIAQLFAYHNALQKGMNPDAPGGLSAWISL